MAGAAASVFTTALMKLASAVKWREALGLSTALETLAAAYPVGSVYISTVSTDPATLLGFGTWVAFAEGEAIFGFKSGDPTFGTGGATGGAETHALTTAEVPAITTASNTAVAGAANRMVGFTGANGTAFSLLNPYIVAYVWTRTA